MYCWNTALPSHRASPTPVLKDRVPLPAPPPLCTHLHSLSSLSTPSLSLVCPGCSQSLKCPPCFLPRSQGLRNPSEHPWARCGMHLGREGVGEALLLLVSGAGLPARAQGMRTVCDRDTYWLLGAQRLETLVLGCSPGGPGGHSVWQGFLSVLPP